MDMVEQVPAVLAEYIRQAEDTHQAEGPLLEMHSSEAFIPTSKEHTAQDGTGPTM